MRICAWLLRLLRDQGAAAQSGAADARAALVCWSAVAAKRHLGAVLALLLTEFLRTIRT